MDWIQLWHMMVWNCRVGLWQICRHSGRKLVLKHTHRYLCSCNYLLFLLFSVCHKIVLFVKRKAILSWNKSSRNFRNSNVWLNNYSQLWFSTFYSASGSIFWFYVVLFTRDATFGDRLMWLELMKLNSLRTSMISAAKLLIMMAKQ